MKHDDIKHAFSQQDKPVKKRRRKTQTRVRCKVKDPVKKVAADGVGINNKYMSYEQASLFCQTAKYVVSSTDYRNWVKIKGYKFLPLNPVYMYKEEWQGWPAYLGTKPRSNLKRMPYLEAKAVVQRLAIKYNLCDGDIKKNWLIFCDEQYLLPDDERELPKNIPRHISSYYEEWEGWPKFFGKGMHSKLESLQQRATIQAEDNDVEITTYEGRAVYAITTGVDPMNDNMVKVIVNHDGLSQMLAQCNSLQYDIHGIYLFDKNQLQAILDNLTSAGTDKGDSCFHISDMNALLSGLSFDTIEIDRKLYL